MAPRKQSQGVGPPAPVDVAALQPETMLGGERDGAVATAPGPAARAATAAGGLRCKAFLVLAACLSATALPYSLGSGAALPSPAAQRGASDDPVATHEDLLKKPMVQQRGRVPMGSVGAPGCFPRVEGDVARDTDGDGWSQGALTTDSPLTARTSPQRQPGSRHGEGLRLGTAVAVTRWLGTGLPATSAQLLQAVGDPSPRSRHPFALGSLHGTEPGSSHATQVPAVTSAYGLGQPVGTAEPRSLGAHIPPGAPAQPGTLVAALSQSHSTADQMLALGASPDPWTVSRRADLSLAASSKPPAEVTASHWPSGARAGTAGRAPSSLPSSDRPTASGFSDVQHGALGVGATTRGRNGLREEERPSPGLSDPGVGEGHTGAPHLVPLPEVPSALPAERTPGLAETHPGTAWLPSAVTPKMSRDTGSAGTSLRGEAALLVGTILAKVPGNGSGLLATVSAPLSSAALARDASHTRGLAPFLPPAESGGPAVTSEIRSDGSSLPTQQTLLTSTEAHPSPARTRVPSAAGPAVTGMSLAAPNAIPEAGVAEAPSKDGAAVVASPSPRDAGVTHGSSLGSPTQRPSLHPDPFLTTVSEDRPTAGQGQAVKVAEVSVLHGWVAVAEEAGHSESRTTSVGPAATPAGPPEPTHVSPDSVPPPSSKNPAPGHCSEAARHTGTTSLLSPSYLLTSTGASSIQTLAAPAAATLAAQSMSSPSVISQHPSTAREHLPAAAEEAFTLAEPMTMGDPGSPGAKAPASHLPGLPFPARVLPLEFRLVGIAYTQALSNRASESYRELEEEVRLMLNQMLSTYETFLQANVLEFTKGSVVVRGEALFRGDAPAPTNSHLIRTVVTEASRRRSVFSWQLEPQSVQSSGFSLKNLDPEKLSISLTVFQLERGRTDHLERLISAVTWSLGALYRVRNFTLVRLRHLSGELEITGDLYLDTIIHADIAKVLQALTALATCSVDLTSLSVEGAKLDLQVYPVSFLITNRHFSEDFLDPFATEHQELARGLGDVVARVLRDHRSFLQVVIRGFLPGSLICHGEVVFQQPAPTSLEVLEALVLSVGLNKTLAGSDFQVDPYSLAVGEATLEPPQPKPGFPEYGVAIMVVCGLCIITAPIVLLVCLRIKRLGWWDRAVLRRRRDPEAGAQTLEMDNQGFWASSEQGPEDVHMH